MTARVAIRTIGCRLNQAESADMAAQFEAAGCTVVRFGEACDVCVIHSCAVTQSAEQTSLRLARAAARSRPRPFVAVSGCAAELDPAGVRNATGADLVVPRRERPFLAGLLLGDASAAGTALHPARACSSPLPCLQPRETSPHTRPTSTRALVKVQDGCDFGCAFCVVPAARGRPVSRPLRAVVEEVRRLADAGYRECVLTGANLGCYSDRGLGLVDLLARLADVPGIERIRLSSIEMSTAERAVIDFAVGCPKVCRCLHIPLQSGDDGVLGAMGRRYTAAGYRELAAYAADLLPACGLGTDVIVGFPGEDETAFANTLALLRDLPFTRLHVFPFSPRPGTRAADMPGQVPAVEKKRRAAAVAVLGRQKERAFTERWIGRPVSVIVERVTRHGGCGWTGEYVAARVPPAPDVRRGSLVTFVPADAEDDVLVASP